MYVLISVKSTEAHSSFLISTFCESKRSGAWSSNAYPIFDWFLTFPIYGSNIALFFFFVEGLASSHSLRVGTVRDLIITCYFEIWSLCTLVKCLEYNWSTVSWRLSIFLQERTFISNLQATTFSFTLFDYLSTVFPSNCKQLVIWTFGSCFALLI